MLPICFGTWSALRNAPHNTRILIMFGIELVVVFAVVKLIGIPAILYQVWG